MNTHPLKRYVEALGELCLSWRGDPTLPVQGVVADSREVRPGYLFCAIPGACRDGIAYAPDALRRGAIGVVSVREVALPPGAAAVRVDDAYRAAAILAECAACRPADSLRLLGITGTNGKTTCAYLLRDMLRSTGCRTGMVGTVCYDTGTRIFPAERTTPTPFVLQDVLTQMVDSQCVWAVLEMSSHALVQHRTGSAVFRGGLFTNLTGDHLDYHQSMERYYQAKAILFRELLSTDGGIAVVNVDDRHGRRLVRELRESGRIEVLTYGEHPDADASWRHVDMRFDGTRFELELRGESRVLVSPLIGHHNVANIAGSATLALACGVAAEAVVEAVRVCAGAPGRLQAVPSASGFSAYVDYAHTDDALENVLGALRRLDPRRLLLVFGCGGDRDRSKRPRMGAVAARLADRVIVTSDNPRSEDSARIIQDIVDGMGGGGALSVEPDRRQAIRLAVSEAGTGDVILVAGKGHETYQDVGGRRLPFDDAEELRAAIRDREETA